MVIENLAIGLIGKAADKVTEKVTGEFAELMVNILKDKWNHKSKKGNRLIKEIKDNSSIYNNFIKCHIMENLYFKTIDGKQKNIFIEDVFIESDIKDEDGELNSIIDILHESNGNIICLEGIAGQGKSTLLRKILIECIRFKFKLPIFIELRKIEKESSIIDEIVNVLKIAGLNADKEGVESALSSGRLLLLLDGFDEIESTFSKSIFNELEYLKLNIKTPIILTSRPDTPICNSPMVKNMKLKNLSETQVLEIIKKRMSEDDFKKSNIALKNNPRLMKSLITPILVSLFCASYPETDYIPVTASDYYGRIFHILYEGHDKKKSYYDREKKFNIQTDDAFKVFTAFSFLCFSLAKLSFDKGLAIENISKSLTKIGVSSTNLEQNNFLDDLIRITGLIKNDGHNRYTFIHRSILEYHTAIYILESDEKKKKYQDFILKKLLLSQERYISVTEFLFEKDKESTIKNIAIPLLESIGLTDNNNDSLKIKENLINISIPEARIAVLLHKEIKEKEKVIGKNSVSQTTKGFYLVKLQNLNDISNSINIFIDNKKEKLNPLPTTIQHTIFEQEGVKSKVIEETFSSSEDVKSKEIEKTISSSKGFEDIFLDEKNSLSMIDLIDRFNLRDVVYKDLDPTVTKIVNCYTTLSHLLNVMNSQDTDFDWE